MHCRVQITDGVAREILQSAQLLLGYYIECIAFNIAIELPHAGFHPIRRTRPPNITGTGWQDEEIMEERDRRGQLTTGAVQAAVFTTHSTRAFKSSP